MTTRSFVLVLAMPAVVSLCMSCHDTGDDSDKIFRETAVNKENAENPPVANDITLQFREKPDTQGNFKMTVNLQGQVKDQYFAYEVDEKKIVMRDDGRGADSIKGDGIYSVYITIAESEVKAMVNQQNESIDRGKRLEASNKELISAMRFNQKDTARSAALHSVLLSSPDVSFVDRQVKFERKTVQRVDVDEIFRIKRPFHIFPDFICPPPPADLIPKSLMITSLGVVEDASRTWNPVNQNGNKNGAWTFNNIINNMVNKAATGKSATEFVLSLLKSWDTNISLNGDVAGARTAIDNIINSWIQRSLAHGLPADTLDMAEAPVKLLSIVNRLDLRQTVGYGGGNAGEGRFVFALLNSSNTSVQNSPLRFTIIFEYGVNKRGCRTIQSWAQQWYNLHTMNPGDAAYNSALQAITDQFVNANTNSSKPNGSSLNQIRTDELAIGSPWQLREFNIDGTTHLLKLVTVKKNPRNTPGSSLNNSALLADFINAHCSQILNNNYDVPETVNGQPFLGAASDNQNGAGDVWRASITCTSPDIVRRIFSLNTCNACHGGETQTAFTHVDPVRFGTRQRFQVFSPARQSMIRSAERR